MGRAELPVGRTGELTAGKVIYGGSRAPVPGAARPNFSQQLLLHWGELAGRKPDKLRLSSGFPLSPLPCCDRYLLFVGRDERLPSANF